MRCDLKQRRCVPVETAQCRYDWECEGEREWCVHDPDTGKFLLRRNVCLPEGKCGVKEREVECCYDTDCPKGYFCDLDHTCKERIAEMKECPWECCVNEPGYFDKPCPEGEICYADHTCHPPGAGIKACNYNGICEPERGEDKENCPADCKVPPIPPPPAKDNMLLITVILMLGMFFLFGGMMVLMGRKKSGKKWIRRRY
ncbi:MAG: hypothetical protein DRP11_05170 [Candidatus Aenigmatarchaeota archaeon]|nr:MAG: hypothetical protein DRP11_05170 [Candidatus Aenigmarchaeota archaeon]